MLTRYRYEFEWRHEPDRSIITFMKVLAPRSGKVVSMTNGPFVTVIGMKGPEPFIITSGRQSLQDLIAITEEIRHERQRLLENENVVNND